MLSPVATFRALRGAAEHLACDVVTEVEPRPGGQASAVFFFAAVIGLARARAYWSRKAYQAIAGNQIAADLGQPFFTPTALPAPPHRPHRRPRRAHLQQALAQLGHPAGAQRR